MVQEHHSQEVTVLQVAVAALLMLLEVVVVLVVMLVELVVQVTVEAEGVVLLRQELLEAVLLEAMGALALQIAIRVLL